MTCPYIKKIYCCVAVNMSYLGGFSGLIVNYSVIANVLEGKLSRAICLGFTLS